MGLSTFLNEKIVTNKTKVMIKHKGVYPHKLRVGQYHESMEEMFSLAVQSFGFPKMHKEKQERRDFPPFLFAKLRKYGYLEFSLEEGYGEAMGYSKEDYVKENPSIMFCNHEECFQKEGVVVLRAPSFDDLELMKPGTVLFSMLHFDTQEYRNKMLLSLGLTCFSMDGLVDDYNRRLLVNYIGTAGAGVKVAYSELKSRWKGFFLIDRKPIRVSIIGLGELAQKAAKWFEILSDSDFLDCSAQQTCRGLYVRLLPRSITRDREVLDSILRETDILVDASKRVDTSEIIVHNESVSLLPNHAVILDLSADSYEPHGFSVQVKGIEGIPTGNLDEYIIEIDSNLYESIPPTLKSQNRRLVVSCNAWPGIEPRSCMDLYSKQIIPFIVLISKKDFSELDLESDDLFERALVRSSLDYFLSVQGAN